MADSTAIVFPITRGILGGTASVVGHQTSPTCLIDVRALKHHWSNYRTGAPHRRTTHMSDIATSQLRLRLQLDSLTPNGPFNKYHFMSLIRIGITLVLSFNESAWCSAT